uniref:UMA domain-containing protein n=1 Tax=Coptotermes formosanus TaxID=36987 RepID=R4V394_COPFO|nr:hypothetical protein [Coptotermes formosanus]
MSLSWLFGSKKKTLDSEPQQQTSELQDDYVLVANAENFQANGEDGESGHCPALPYSLAPDIGMVPHGPSTSTKSTINACHQNFLHGVPFKLYPNNMSPTLDAVNRRRMHASEFLLHISHLNLKSFEYDFLVEKSVVLEAGDRDLG